MKKNWHKLQKASKLEDNLLRESQRIVYRDVGFIDERQVPLKYRLKAYELVHNVDLKDIVFVALNEYRESILWSGDKYLIKGLKAKGYEKVITTEGMIKLRNRLASK